MEIIDFYNKGAQVQVPTEGVNMTHSFTASGSGEPREIGYVPKPNSGKPEGAAFDVIEHRGKSHLLLKGGHIYSVRLDADGPAHVISAEEGHVALPLPAGAADLLDVEEYDPDAAPKVEETAESEGTLRDEAGDDAADKKE